MVRTSVTQSTGPRVPLLFLPHFDVICDLLLNRRTATWNLFVNYSVIRRGVWGRHGTDIASCYNEIYSEGWFRHPNKQFLREFSAFL